MATTLKYVFSFGCSPLTVYPSNEKDKRGFYLENENGF